MSPKQCLRYDGAMGGRIPFTTACSPPFQFIQNTFLKHHGTTRQQAIAEKGVITFKHNSRQERSQKFAMGGCFGGLGEEPPAAGGQLGSWGEAPSCRRLGVWGQSPQRYRHGGLGAEHPALENFAFFC